MPHQTTRTRRHDAFGYRAILRVALPLAVTVGCFSITLFTDRTLLMWYGPASSAASMSAGNLYWAVACIPITAVGFTTPLVALAAGQRRNRSDVVRRIWSILWQGVWLTLACIPLFAAAGLLSPSVFASFGHEPDLATKEALYFRTLLLVAPASMLEAVLSAFFVGRRMTQPILRTNVASALINVGLDAWFIFGGFGVPAMGVFGAALATATAMWIKVTVFVVLLMRFRSFRRHLAVACRPDRRMMFEILIPGSALGVQQLFRSGLLSYVLLVIGSASVAGLAATSATLSLYQLLSIPAIGLATAVTVVTGQGNAHGGGLLAAQVIRRSIILGFMVACGIVGLIVFFPQTLLRIQLDGLDVAQHRVIEPLAITLLGYAAIYGLVDIAGLILGAAVKGIGKTFILLIATAVPGALSVGLGRWSAPSGSGAAEHWWMVLIAWSFAQTVIIAISLLNWQSRATSEVEADQIDPRSLDTLQTS